MRRRRLVSSRSERRGELVRFAGGQQCLRQRRSSPWPAAQRAVLLERGEVDVRGDVAHAGLLQHVFARGVAAIAHQRAGGKTDGFGARVAVIDGEDVSGWSAPAMRSSQASAARFTSYQRPSSGAGK